MDLNEHVLHGYQDRGIAYGLKEKQTYYAVDLGLGKTAIALNIAKALPQPTFVISPL